MNVAIYARVSTEAQAKKESSIPEQIERCRKYCEALDWTVYGVYTDAGFSGANTDRPALKNLIADVSGGHIDKILVYKLDRLSRSQKDTLSLIEDSFLANGVDFVSMSENFDTSTPFGRAMIGILSVFAQLERETIRERLMMGVEARAKRGQFHGSRYAPCGYDYIDGELIVNDFEKLIVQRIFRRYDDGHTPYEISCELNAEGLRSNGGQWHRNTVYKILQSRTYVGDIKRNDQWYPGIHEPIIDHELFDRVQERLSSASADAKSRRNKTRQKSLLGGLLYCGCCGNKCVKNTRKSVKSGITYKYDYYTCKSRFRQKERDSLGLPPCKNRSWRVPVLNQLVIDEIEKLRLDPDHKPKKKKAPDDPDAAIRKEIEKTESQISRLLDLYTVGTIDKDVLANKINALNEKKASLLEAIEKNRAKKKITSEEASALVTSFHEVFKKGSNREIQEVVSALIDRIVLAGDDVSIFWKF